MSRQPVLVADKKANDRAWSTSLLNAARQGDNEIMRALLKAGAKIEAQTHDNKTAIRYAAHFGHIEAVKLLIARGAKLVKAEDGVTPIGNYSNPEINKIIKAAQAFDKLQINAVGYLRESEVLSITHDIGAILSMPKAFEILATRLVNTTLPEIYKGQLAIAQNLVVKNLQKLLGADSVDFSKIIIEKCMPSIEGGTSSEQDEAPVPAESVGSATAVSPYVRHDVDSGVAGGAAAHLHRTGGAASHLDDSVSDNTIALANIALGHIIRGNHRFIVIPRDSDAILAFTKTAACKPADIVQMALQYIDLYKEENLSIQDMYKLLKNLIGEENPLTKAFAYVCADTAESDGAVASESSVIDKALIAMNKIIEGNAESFNDADHTALFKVSARADFNPNIFVEKAIQYHQSHRELGELKDFISKIAEFLSCWTGDNSITSAFVSLDDAELAAAQSGVVFTGDTEDNLS